MAHGSLTVGSVGQGPYLYNGFAQLASRQVTANPTKTFHMLYDQSGNLIAEADAATGEILREYFWLGGRPVAVMDSSADHAIYAVHVDHLDRPRMMTDWNGTIVWRADYLPFGEVRTSSGPASLNYRFPGQWFMLETGLHYNWHRWYDATTGRYTQPDPIGMPDGPSRYAYALNSPIMKTDQYGLIVIGGMSVPIDNSQILLCGTIAKPCVLTKDDDDYCTYRCIGGPDRVIRNPRFPLPCPRTWDPATDREGGNLPGTYPPDTYRFTPSPQLNMSAAATALLALALAILSFAF